MSHIVITYFKPFGGRVTNASKEVVTSLNGYTVKQLPVSWLKVPSLIDEILLDNPDYLFLVGEAGSYVEITVEKLAHNISNGKDNEGVNKDNEQIISKGPTEIATKFDIDKLPYRISNDAGKYLCNYTYYLALSKAKTTKVLFIHLPYIDNNLNELKDSLLDIIKKLTD